MRILLTGHKGFVGSRLKEVLEKDHVVYGIDLVEGKDILTANLDYTVDLVIHLAGKSGVRQSLKNPTSYWYNNVEGSRRIFETFKNTRIIYASSSSAYEPHLNPYAASKCIVEYAAANHSNCLGVRLHTVYSDVPRKDMFFDKLLNGTLEHTTKHYRDFIHLEDVCTAFELLVNSTLTGVVDIGTGTSAYIPSIAPNLKIKEYTPHERTHTQADIKFLTSLGFKPKYTVENFLTNKGIDVKLQYITGENP
jgi:nucleoside-diphosphate-sugar epimerase